MYERTWRQPRLPTPQYANSSGALNVKAGVKTREHGSRREHLMSREPPGYYFGKRVLIPEYSCRWSSLERCVVHLEIPTGCIYEDAGISLSELLLEWAEQDGETIRRAAHRSRAQAWSSSWPSTPCSADREEQHLLWLPFVGDHFSVLFSVLIISSSVLKVVPNIFFVTTAVVICTVVRQQSARTELNWVENITRVFYWRQ